MLYGGVPSISVYGIKINGVSNGGITSVGPTSTWGNNSHSKAQAWNAHNGDLAWLPVTYGVIFDNDFYDHPIIDARPW